MDIRIDVFVRCFPDGYRLHGMRRWPAIPRVGESMFVDNGKQPWPAQLCIVEVVNWYGDQDGKLDRVEVFVKAESSAVTAA